jgi:hypothetical protein
VTLFDAYVSIDWSAAASPGPKAPSVDAVWVGELAPGLGRRLELYHRTRTDGRDHISRILTEHVRHGRRVLAGFDFSFGYPAGLAAALGFQSADSAWRSIWRQISGLIRDGQNNANNRFEVAGRLNRMVSPAGAGPFWGRPPSISESDLPARSPGFPFQTATGNTLPRLRLVEERLPGIQESWKLYGVGSVGGQVLTGLPVLEQLRSQVELTAVSRVWPFETGFQAKPCPDSGPFVLYAEMWPGLVARHAAAMMRDDDRLIRDQAQVRALCEWAEQADRDGRLTGFLDAPSGLSLQQKQTCLTEEGWVLGTS